MRIGDLFPQKAGGFGEALQAASPLLLAMGQGLSSGQGINAFMPQGMAGMMALQERQKEKAANDKLDEMLGTFNVSPAERALLSTMDLSGKQQYLANLMQSRRTGGGSGGSGIDPAMWQSIMGGDMAQPSAAPSGAGMLSMGQPVTMGGPERGQLSFGLPEADTGAPLQGAAGMMGQSVPQQPVQPPQRPPMGSPASLSFGQMAQQPAQMPQTDPMAQIRQIEARMMQVSQLPPSKTTAAAMNALQARREILLAQAERNQPPEDPIADLRARFEFAQRELGMDPQQAGQWARSGQQINVNNTLQGDQGPAANEDYVKDRNKSFAARMGEFEDAGLAARRALTSLDVMDKMMEQPGFFSGAGGETVLTLRRAGAALGLADPEGIDSMETFNAQAKNAALDVMGGSLGTGFSNADRDFVTDQVPSLGNTPEGNKLLVEVQRRIQQRKLEIMAMAQQYEVQNGQIDTQFLINLNEWANANPVFADFEMPKGAGDRPALDDLPPVPEGVMPREWQAMTPEERALWLN